MYLKWPSDSQLSEGGRTGLVVKHQLANTPRVTPSSVSMMRIDMVGSDENEESSAFWTLPESGGDVNSDSEFS